ncbi:MAG TPA: hypothetical protein VK648_06625 [Gemmatimonadaceae bacterium]|nr:MAG: hypothetical protein DMF56_03280 [Acidobacteriota bacterium]HTD83450.1 hypothetical protein [Gemmatimonadaceae bacterium]
MCFSSWRDSAYNTSDAIRRSFRRYKASTAQPERAYRGWDIITAVVEMTEIVATAILNARDPLRFAAHQASNDQIEELFTSIRDHGISGAEVRNVLGLQGPRGLDATAMRTLRIFENVVERIALILRDTAVFWLDHIDHARWFRHYPATLTPEETWIIDKNVSDADRAKAEELAAMPGAIELVTIMKDTGFEHTVLREELVVSAAWLGDVATQFIMNILANSGLDVRAPKKTALFPGFLAHLTAEDRELLFANASYVDPR